MSIYSKVVSFIRYPARALFRIKITGSENEPDVPYIVCANHSAYSDPVVIATSLKTQVHFISRSSLMRFWGLRTILKWAEVIPIHRDTVDTEALKTVVAFGRSGKTVGIFPQGTRIRGIDPVPEQAEAGLGLIASMTKLPVLPISIVTKKRQVAMLRRTYVVIGKPIYPKTYMSLDNPKRKAIAEFLFTPVCRGFDGYFT